MKHLFILFIAIAVIFPSCRKCHKKNSIYTSSATITGPDLGMTSCSGGYWIQIDATTVTNRVETLPAGSGIDLTTATFPIRVNLNWHYNTPNPCGFIIVDAITMAN